VAARTAGGGELGRWCGGVAERPASGGEPGRWCVGVAARPAGGGEPGRWCVGVAARPASGGEPGRWCGGAACGWWRGSGAACWWWRGLLAVARRPAGGGAMDMNETAQVRERESRVGGLGDLGFFIKFDGVHVPHELNLRTWVPTFLTR
jgi:hypothetical protein